LTYQSDQYGFQIQYPSTWQIGVSKNGIHIYKRGELFPQNPTHQTPFTNISIFPQGIATEGVSGEAASTSISFKEPAKRVFDYILDDGTPWATYASFKNIPASWDPSGFVWARVDIKNEVAQCEKNGEIIASGICEMGIEHSGEHTYRTGKIDAADRHMEETILKTFKFIKAPTL
jgi:hypothetical protein